MIFIDTGAFIARYIKADQNHPKSTKLWHKIKENQETCYTSNFVLDETFTLLGRRAGYMFAAERAEKIYASAFIKILRPQEQEEIDAIELLKKYADQSMSYTDCISFTLMKKERIKTVFSFDKHFQYAGYLLYD